MSQNITGNPNSRIYGNGSIGSFGTSDYFNPSNLTVLYSMRRAVYYNGPVVNVRRSTDSVSSDFYTDSTQSYFTTGPDGTGNTYDNWLTGGTGFVKIWYDQSGKGNNASNLVNGATQPLIAKITAPNDKLYYTINWISANSTILTMATAMTPNTIFCHWWNNNSAYGSIISQAGDKELRFGGGGATNINGDSNSNDWYFSGTGTKIAYVNGASSTTVICNGVGGLTTTGWNVMGTSVSTPATFNLRQVGIDGFAGSRSINGYMVEIFAHNTTIDSNNMVQYYNDRLF